MRIQSNELSAVLILCKSRLILSKLSNSYASVVNERHKLLFLQRAIKTLQTCILTIFLRNPVTRTLGILV